MRFALIVASTLALSACATVGGPGVSSYFGCPDGKVLKVTYTRGGAIVEKGGGAPIHLKSTQSAGAGVFTNRQGMRLTVMGDNATLIGRTREAPQTCRRVAVPR